MGMTFVFNASPMIVLAKAGLLDRITQLADSIMVPQEVADEITQYGDPNDPAICWMASHSSLIIQSPAASPFLMAWDLGAGETAVLSHTALNPSFFAVLDDLAARRCAQAMGLRVIGTLGLILLAKQNGVIQAVAPALDSIVAAGLIIHFAKPYHRNPQASWRIKPQWEPQRT